MLCFFANGKKESKEETGMTWRYVKNKIPLNLDHFLTRAKNSGNWDAETINQDEFIALLLKKIEGVSFDSIKQDISRFIKDSNNLNLWSAKYFADLSRPIVFASKKSL
ncbi:MAG: hypothetical protein JWN76_2839 [Chitinophagaceae bacterium]|nr:hypothetical protein [Chitinophagaceae bacterium]